MDKKFAQAIAADMHKALEEVAKKHGLVYSYRGGKYAEHDGSFTPKIIFHEPAQKALGEDKSDIPAAYIAEFKYLNQVTMGLAGKTFKVPGTGTITLIGYRSKARKNPLIFRRDGKYFVGSHELLRACKAMEPVA